MRLLIVDPMGCGLALGFRAAQWGHKVKWFVTNKPTDDPTIGLGFPVTKVDNWRNHVTWAELIFVTDNSKFIPNLEAMKKQGLPYFGPSVESSSLEIKRGEGMKFLQRHGIDAPPFETFKSLKDAEAFVWKNEKRWVFKTLGDNEDKSLSYCSKSPADMIARLQRWQKLGMNPKGEVMLQQFIPGIEVGVSRWMGSNGWVSDPNINFEQKKLMSGNHGPNTGEMGTVMFYVKSDKLDEEVLKPLERVLMQMGHLGDIDLNCIVDDSGKAWPLEFTARPGWPAFNMMLEAHQGDPVKWMLDAVKGDRTLEVSYEVGVCVLLCQPDFPYCKSPMETKAGIPIYLKSTKHIQPQEVRIEKLPVMDGDKVVEKPIWATAGEYLAVVTALGPTVSAARQRAYKTLEDVQIPDALIRDDIGENLKKDLPELQKHGYVKDVKWQ
jgi:phosphoribosylamine---glycine ligase